MKFGRRAFLQFAAGAVGGTLLTPLPWKLAGDSAKWTQNWPWEPSPERGDITTVASTCLLCNGGCGIQAQLVNGHRAILIEGNPQHPVNKGGVCPLGASGLLYLYAPYRVSQPMKQTKKRGDASGFQPISWTDAINELSARIAQVRSEGKPQSMACITGQPQSSMYALWQQFFTACGSKNLFRMPSELDGQQVASLLTFGQAAPVAFSLEKASYILSFGAGLFEGWGTPGRVHSVYRMWRDGTPGKPPVKLVQVESRCSSTAAKADDWVAVKPGSEAALALGIAHVLIRDKLYDANFAAQNTFGFEDWTDAKGKTRQGFKSYVAANYSPEKVSGLTGVDAAKIQEMAKELVSQKNALVVWGNGKGMGPSTLYHDLSFLALNALIGNLKPGGLVSLASEPPLGSLPQVEPDSVAQQGLQQPRLDLAQAQTYPAAGNGLYAFLDAAAHSPAYPIEIMMIHEANPAYSLPEAHLFKDALAKTPFVVSFSSYMDETAQEADLILPNHCALERLDDVIGIPGAPYAYYAVASPILPPQKSTKHTGDVIIEVAKKLEGGAKTAVPWSSYEAFLKERVKGLASAAKGAVADSAGKEPWKAAPGETLSANFKDDKDLWTKLSHGSCWYDAPAGSTTASTDSGNYELAVQSLQKKGVNVDDDAIYLPHFAPLSPSGDEKEYPLLLVNYEMMNLPNDYLPSSPFLNKTLPDSVLKGKDLLVEINPQTAQAAGLSEGDRARVKTSRGEAPIRVHLSAGARPGVVYIAQGFGHTAYDVYVQEKGVNANNITEVQIDPVTGLGVVWATRAQLHRA